MVIKALHLRRNCDAVRARSVALQSCASRGGTSRSRSIRCAALESYATKGGIAARWILNARCAPGIFPDMPVITPRKTLPNYDAIIVGSGAAGGMSAYVLCKAGLKVLMLEAGRN